MKLFNRILSVALLVGVVFTTTACFEENFITYDGPLMVEMAPYTAVNARDAALNGWLSLFTFAHNAQSVDLPVRFRVNLIGPHQPNPVNVNYQITTTGTAGTHFVMSAPMQGTLTIQPGTSFADIPLTINRTIAAVPPGTNYHITMAITGADVEILQTYSVQRYQVRRNPAP
jgi:hypothetical protein